ncbi:hypothetical protein BJV82DRAFT_241044 [Fennellomyces sp. T-0311]|nr:hypothetical protein BJV82DRAFT_241044 [Fennellomyces sp. T-0311]
MCLKGATCLYRHTTPDVDEAASDDTFDSDLSGSSDTDESPSTEDERSTKKSRKCIRFWYGSGCRREASECFYAHEDLQHIGVCEYWFNEKECPHGSTCPYKHSETIRALEFEDNPRNQNIFYDPAENSYNRRTDSEKRYALITKLRTPPSLDVLPRMNSGRGNIELIYTPEREKAYSYGDKMCQTSKLYQQAVDQQDHAKAKKLEQEIRILARKMKEAHAVASQKIFDICNSDTLRKMKFIDVHGQHIGEAKHHIKQWLESFHSSGPKVVYIVTGAGRHSKKEAASKGQLRPAIRNYLEQMFVTHETSVYGDDSKGVFAIIFCIHHYTPNHHCMLCPFFVPKK